MTKLGQSVEVRAHYPIDKNLLFNPGWFRFGEDGWILAEGYTDHNISMVILVILVIFWCPNLGQGIRT